MNNQQSPLVPQGQLMDAKSKGRARFKVAVFAVLAVHGVALMALLIAGCRREETPPAASTDLIETNSAPLAPSIDDTNSIASDTNYIAPTMDSTNVPMDAGMSASNTTVQPEQPVVPQVPAGESEYKVAKGDTYSTIAKKMGVSVKAITDANPGVNPARLQIGQSLKIPAATSNTSMAAPKATETTSAGAAQTYTVKSGDNLTKVAAKLGVSVKALRSANNLTTDRITVGQKLKIPAKAGAQ